MTFKDVAVDFFTRGPIGDLRKRMIMKPATDKVFEK